jgi:hypothetical protein
MLAYDYPFLSIIWTMIVIFAWIIWFWLLISIGADLFRRHDCSGWVKAFWLIFIILVPFVGVLVYLIVNSKGMAERNVKNIQQSQAEMDTYIKSVAGSGGAAAEIERAKGLLDSGAITQAEFDQIKSKALASS